MEFFVFILAIILAIFFINFPALAVSVHMVGMPFYGVIMERLGRNPDSTSSLILFLVLSSGYIIGNLKFLRLRKLNNFPVFSWGLFFSWWILSLAIVSPSIINTQYYLGLLIVLTMAPFLGAFFSKDISIILRANVIIGIFLIILSFLTGQVLSTTLRWSISTNVSPLSIAYSSGIAALCAVGLVLEKKINIIVAICVGLGSLYIIFSSGSRGPLIALVLSLVLLILLSNTRENIPTRALIIIVFLLGGWEIFRRFLSQYVSGRFFDLVYLTTSFSMNVESLSRIEIWQRSISLWLDHPWIGNGVGYYALIDPERRSSHNFLLEVLVEMGIIGLLLFLTFLFALVINAIKAATRRKKWDHHGAILVSLLGFVLVKLFFSSQIKADYQFWLICGLTLSWSLKRNDTEIVNGA